MHNRSYIELLRHARRMTRRVDEAEDLLQAVLLAAVEAGRNDISCPDNRKWLIGALRKRALFDARSAVRRRRRETSAAVMERSLDEGETLPSRFISTLPPGLRTTALLVLTGHTRAEIRWLLRLSDPALRQRFAEIRRRWRNAGGHEFEEIPGLKGTLAFGRIRQTLLDTVRRDGVVLASHDPDGHLFVVTSQNGMVRQPGNVPTTMKR